MVNWSWPFWSVFETMRGIYLDAADAEWNGDADDAEAVAAEDIVAILNNKRYVLYILLLIFVINFF
jgi:hypothetical protein